ncbi:MAG: hypothetical protein HFJ48_00095 [Clostridia bacterium]|nr:hypothetical protein [Clostridia bacterium]
MSSWEELKKKKENETNQNNQGMSSWEKLKKKKEIMQEIKNNQPEIAIGPNQNTTTKTNKNITGRIVSEEETKGSKRVNLDIYNKTRNNAKSGNYIGYMADKAITGVQSFSDSLLNLYTTDIMKNNEKAKQLNTILGNEEQNKKIDKSNNNLKELTNNTDYQAKKAGLSFAETDFSEPVQLLGNATESVGAMLPSIAVSTISPTAGLITTGIGAAGGAMKEAMDDGATPEQAQKVGLLKGSVEIATEKLFGGVKFFGKGTLDDLFNEKVLDKVSSNIGKFAVRQGYDIVGETIEENLSNIAGYGIDKWILNKDLPKLEEILKDADETTKTTILSTILLKGLGASINTQNQNDFINKDNLTKKQKEDIETVATMILEKEMLDNNNKKNVANSIVNENNNKVQQSIPTQGKNSLNSNLNGNFDINYDSIYNTTAKQYNIDINDETVQSIDRITNQRGVQAKYDASIFENSNTNAVWRTSTDINGKITRQIVINPNANSNKTLQNIIIHELTHDLEGTNEYNELQNLILNYNKKSIDYESTRKSLEEIYSKVYNKNSNKFQTLVNQEVIADILGNKLGDQNFVNTLTTEKPSLGKRIYNWVVDKLNKINKLTGYKSEELFWEDIKNKFKNAYRQDYKNNNKSLKYSIQTDINGNKYVKVDTDQNIFEGINKKDYNKIAKMYIQDYLMGETTLSNTDKTTIDSKSSNKYTNPNQKPSYITEKMRLTPELKNVLKIANKDSTSLPTKDNSKYKSWEYYKFNFELDGKNFEGTINIGIDKNGNKHFYEINKIHSIPNSSVSTNKVETVNIPNNSILPTQQNVNNTTKYSMQESENNSDSFNLSRKNTVKIDGEKSVYIDENGKSNDIYFRFDNEGQFKGKEHKSGVAFWEDMIDDYIYDSENQNEIKRIYNIEDIYEISDTELERLKREIAEDKGYITDGASVFDLTEEGIEWFKNYDLTHHETDYSKINIFTGEKNGLGVDGENVVIPERHLIELDTKEFLKIIEDIEFDEKFESASEQTKNKELISEIVGLINKNISNSKKYSTSENTWQLFLDKHYKNSGKGETIKDVKLPVLKYLDEKHIDYEVDEYNNIISIEDPKALEEYYNNSKKTEKQVKLPVKQNKETNIPVSYDSYMSEESRQNIELLTNEDYEVINKIYEKEGRTEILTEKRKAKILEKYANDKHKIKDSLDVLAQKFINKGHYIDKLSEKANNPELKFIYDRNLNSFAEAQYVIGVAQTDNQGNKIGKSINEIWKPVEDMKLTKEFSEYLLHKHNIDRSGRGKYVLGEDIGPTESTAIALELEQKHPEFKQYAKDIKEFNHNNLINLKEAGLLTQEIIEYLEGIYPNYVTISRDIEENLYVGDDKKTGVGAPIKQATGGSTDIKPLKDTMAEQIIRIKKLINQNKLGQELAKTLKNAKIEQQSNIEATPAVLLEYDTLVEADNKGNKFYTYFENGIQQKLKINEDLYESLKPTQISKLEQILPIKALQKITSIHRSLLTSSNPLFIVTNFFKDFQDGMFNSKYSSKFVKNYGKALNEVIVKGKYYESYMANGGMTNTYFDYNEGITKKSNKFIQKIRNINEIVEQLPRLAEFISTLEDGKSLNEALYNASEITTNFKRGGDIAKALNRNGANFLNASIQGFDKLYRNFSGKNGAKGYVNILTKAAIMGILPSIINHMLLSDDEDYQELPDNDKDLYYLFKYDDGKFIRIPKGRVLSIFGSAGRRTLESIEGKEEAWKGFGDAVINQVAPNNPLEDNILAPIIQVKNNKTWYGSDLVSSRLEKELPKNQYDETTDEFSKWLGKQLNASPKKINYLIDQYSGGVGDILLPMITPQAKENVFKDKFTTDSVLKNRNVSKFYDTLEKQTQIANDSFATDEDELQLKYLNTISKSMGELYKQKREIQMSDISNKEKTEQVRKIQEQINELAKEGLDNYDTGTFDKNYSKIGDEEYYKNGKEEWTKLTDEEIEKNKDISTKTYSDYKQKTYKITKEKRSNGELTEKQGLKNKDKIQILLDSKYTDKEILAIYKNYIKDKNDSEYEILSKFNINDNIKEYLKYKQQEFKSDYEEDGTEKGKAISGSEKQKRYEYVNKSKLTYNQRLLILGMQYKLTDTERGKLYSIVDSNKELTVQEKLEIYKKIRGFTVYKNGTVSY